MGIPGFFSWLQRKYPGVVKDIEARTVDFSIYEETDDNTTSTQTTATAQQTEQPSRTFKCCNLYLDTNGIIHAGSHPPSGKPPADEQEMFSNMHAVLDHIVTLAGPTQLLYIAVDGVAPRAKINQQRARRYMAGREREAARQALVERLMQLKSEDVGPAVALDTATAEAATRGAWDHNAISPGTPFMDRMMASLKSFITQRITDTGRQIAEAETSEAARLKEAGWGAPNLRVIFSGCGVPGEGEHKILDFIRQQKTIMVEQVPEREIHIPRSPQSAEPICNHCIYGEDADLIMLALGLHDPRVRVMRELLHKGGTERPTEVEHLPYAAVDIGLLRKYLDGDLFRPLREHMFVINSTNATATSAEPKADQAVVEVLKEAPAFKFDLERAIDDFILLGCVKVTLASPC